LRPTFDRRSTKRNAVGFSHWEADKSALVWKTPLETRRAEK